MTWSTASFGIGLLTGGLLVLGYASLTLGSQLRQIRFCLQTLAARSKPGRKPRTTKNQALIPPGPGEKEAT